MHTHKQLNLGLHDSQLKTHSNIQTTNIKWSRPNLEGYTQTTKEKKRTSLNNKSLQSELDLKGLHHSMAQKSGNLLYNLISIL